MVKKVRSKAKIGGITLNSTSFGGLLREIMERIEENKKTFIVTPNPEFIVYAQKHSWFRKILNQADFAVPDGTGLVWASKFLALRSPTDPPTLLLRRRRGGWWAPRAKRRREDTARPPAKTPRMVAPPQLQRCWRGLLPARRRFASSDAGGRGGRIGERISGTDLMEKLCQEAAKRGWRVYLFGGKPDVAKKALEILQKRYPGLKGWVSSGPIYIDTSEVDCMDTSVWTRKISSKKPDLLFVALGMGKQEKFIWDNWDKLDVKLAMGVGGAFDYLSGRVGRAPKWVQKSGFEWLYRLIHEPWRFRRQLRLLEFIWLVLKEKFQEYNIKSAT